MNQQLLPIKLTGQFKTTSCTRSQIKNKDYGEGIDPDNELLVYIQIDNRNNTLYIGETSQLDTRFYDHLRSHKKSFDEVYFIQGNVISKGKSQCKHIETLLIQSFLADGNYKILNIKVDQHIEKYDQSKETHKHFFHLWNQKIVEKFNVQNTSEIKNSFLIKYTPYLELDASQNSVINNIIHSFFDENSSSFKRHVIFGEPGTGKTLVLLQIIHQMLYLKDSKGQLDCNYEYDVDLKDIVLIIPQTHSMGLYMKWIKAFGLTGIRVFTPTAFIKNSIKTREKAKYVFVDEAHRLKQFFLKQAYELSYLKVEGQSKNQLDLIEEYSKHLTLVYDRHQRIRPSDIEPETFEQKIESYDKHYLIKQFRSAAGSSYLKWLRILLMMTENRNFEMVISETKNYDFKILPSIGELFDLIQKRNTEFGLSRVVSGYSWKWNSKFSTEYDIFDEGSERAFKWNSQIKGWVYKENSEAEIGCIHTVQGSDLNYVGVIFGKEIDYDYAGEIDGSYDLSKGKIIIHHDQYQDRIGKPIKRMDPNHEELTQLIKRIYYVLMSRGINGCYIHAVNKNMQRYLQEAAKEFRD